MSLTLESLAARVAALEARLVSAEKVRTAHAELPEVDIDSDRGNPVVRKDPPRWKGESFVGSPYSACSAEYLRALAGFLQWKAKKNDEEGKEKYAGYDRLDAARALAHAARIEAAAKEAKRYGTTGHGASAKHAVTPEPDGDGEADVWAPGGNDDSIPF